MSLAKYPEAKASSLLFTIIAGVEKSALRTVSIEDRASWIIASLGKPG
jgi:hypothetical protein